MGIKPGAPGGGWIQKVPLVGIKPSFGGPAQFRSERGAAEGIPLPVPAGAAGFPSPAIAIPIPRPTPAPANPPAGFAAAVGMEAPSWYCW